MLKLALVRPLLRSGLEVVVPCQSLGTVLRTQLVVPVEVSGLLGRVEGAGLELDELADGGGEGLEGEEGEEEGEEGEEVGHCA